MSSKNGAAGNGGAGGKARGERADARRKPAGTPKAPERGRGRGRNPGRPGGIRVAALFSGGRAPYAGTAWSERTAEIKDADGRVVFRQEGVRFPKHFSQLAVNVVASKYFYGELGTEEREAGLDSLVNRVADTIADWGEESEVFASRAHAGSFRSELAWLCANQYGSFNSPVWFNVGLSQAYGIRGRSDGWRWDERLKRAERVEDSYRNPQASACFIQSVTDDLAGIMELARSEAMLFKYGSGSGTDLSTLRSTREKLAGGGRPSGPVSFMRVYDAVASVIKSGGKCLAPDQPVYTAAGVAAAGDLADAGGSFHVLSYSRRLGRVAVKEARAWRSGVKPVVEVVTDKGVFRTSEDHPFVGRDGRAIRAGDLRPGMSLLPLATRSQDGYVRVGLRDGNKGRALLHQLVAADVLGWDTEGKVIHHHDERKTNNAPANLRLLTQSEHAAGHGAEAAASGGHVFQTRRFPKAGESNGMHASRFWAESPRADALREKQSEILKESGRAATMQASASRVRMLNTGAALLNAGHDIASFEGYVRAREAVGRRCPSVPGQIRKFERAFGSYEAFYQELRSDNHEVLSVRPLGDMPVVSIEVEDVEPDDKRRWSEHSYALAPMGASDPFGGGVFVLNTRRAAKMQTMKVSHPDIREFVRCKAAEERKARALIAAGYDPSFNGEAYATVAFQNANLSVRVTDDFLAKAARGETWTTTEVTTGRPSVAFPASELLDEIAECAWLCGDPGVQYEDAIQRWHTCPGTAPINSSNPCSEYMFIDDSACNLASLNLLAFLRPDGSFDVPRFRAACRVFIVAQEILVGRASYPTAKIAENSFKFRTLGLGYANLGALLMTWGVPYDSPRGRSLAASITAIMTAEAYLTSALLAERLGPFEGYERNKRPMLNVIAMHKAAAEAIEPDGRTDLHREAQHAWKQAEEAGEKHGYRNAQVTVLAPTGTIAFMMDCDTTGVEPDIALVKYKTLAGGGMLKIVNQSVQPALAGLGYAPDQAAAILAHVEATGTVEGAPGLAPAHLAVFDCAFPPEGGGRSISWEGHVRMMAAVQPFVSGAISKTVNMPAEATPADIRAAYLLGHELGLKALAVYRDKSKGDQPVSTGDGSAKAKDAAPAAEAVLATAPPAPGPVPRRERLPRTRAAMTHKFDIQGHEGYISVGFYPDGRPGEVFLTMAKEGSTVGGLMDVLGSSVSIGLQYGVPLGVFVEKFGHVRFEPSGFTGNPEIPLAKSIADSVFRWLGSEFIPGYRAENAPAARPALAAAEEMVPTTDAPVVFVPVVVPAPESESEAEAGPDARDRQFARFQSDAPACDRCGAITVRCGTCHRCVNCGNSMGCS